MLQEVNIQMLILYIFLIDILLLLKKTTSVLPTLIHSLQQRKKRQQQPLKQYPSVQEQLKPLLQLKHSWLIVQQKYTSRTVITTTSKQILQPSTQRLPIIIQCRLQASVLVKKLLQLLLLHNLLLRLKGLTVQQVVLKQQVTSGLISEPMTQVVLLTIWLSMQDYQIPTKAQPQLIAQPLHKPPIRMLIQRLASVNRQYAILLSAVQQRLP